MHVIPQSVKAEERLNSLIPPLKSRTDVASIRCAEAPIVNELKIQTSIAFLTKPIPFLEFVRY